MFVVQSIFVIYLRLSLLAWISQVPPDFYIPDFDEDEQNPDERVDRKYQKLPWKSTD